jgi:hypothetical protein
MERYGEAQGGAWGLPQSETLGRASIMTKGALNGRNHARYLPLWLVLWWQVSFTRAKTLGYYPAPLRRA